MFVFVLMYSYTYQHVPYKNAYVEKHVYVKAFECIVVYYMSCVLYLLLMPGAGSVVMTDKTITPAEINLRANQHNLPDKNITVAQFEWGKDPSHLKPPFDIILAADVIYIQDTFPLLLQSLVDLSDRETVILISCKRRYERDDHFFDLLRESGKFSHSVVWQWPKEDKQPENDVKVYKVYLVS